MSLIKFYEELRMLLWRAWKQGFIVTVDLQPTKPLRMGGYQMKGLVRRARKTPQ